MAFWIIYSKFELITSLKLISLLNANRYSYPLYGTTKRSRTPCDTYRWKWLTHITAGKKNLLLDVCVVDIHKVTTTSPAARLAYKDSVPHPNAQLSTHDSINQFIGSKIAELFWTIKTGVHNPSRRTNVLNHFNNSLFAHLSFLFHNQRSFHSFLLQCYASIVFCNKSDPIYIQ